MIYLAFLVMASCLFIVYKEKGAVRFFLFSLILGWLASFFGFIIYLHNIKERGLYMYLFWGIFSGNKFFPEFEVSQSINMEMTITAMNFGIMLFIYSCLCFTISFTRPLKPCARIYILLSIIPLLEFIYYSPWFHKILYRQMFSGSGKVQIKYYEFFSYEDIIYNITSTINYIYLGLAIGLIIYHYFRSPRLKYFQSYVIFIFSGLISIVLLFLTLFWWAPKRLISVTTLSEYVHILPVSFVFEGKMLDLFPYITFMSCVLLIYAIYRYNSTYMDLRNMRNSIVRSIDITGVGIRFLIHMIKNYVMATAINAGTLKSKLKDGDECTVYADRIIVSSNDMLQRLNDIKSKFSLITLNLSLTDIKIPIDKALELTNIDGIELQYNKDEKTPKVLVDVRHMTEVMHNIISNAAYEMKGEPRALNIDISQNEFWVIVSISDTGKGIEKEDIGKIFMPFYTTKNKMNNWGLGLSYCYRVIMAHKGKIFVESEINKGTTFKILLPFINTKEG